MDYLTSLFYKIFERFRWEMGIRYKFFSDATLINQAVSRKNNLGERVLINLGCGTRYDDEWINIDFRGNGKSVFSWDLRKSLPLPDKSCDGIYASHVIEHFDRADARTLLLECHRLLKSGGCLRLVAPDLEAITQAYLHALESVRKSESNAIARHEWMTIELLDQLVRHESGGEMMRYWGQEVVPEESFVAARVGVEYTHARSFSRNLSAPKISSKTALDVGKFRLGGEVHLWMYDEVSLCRLLLECGFSNPIRRKESESSIDGFNTFFLDATESGKIYKPDSFFVEAFVS